MSLKLYAHAPNSSKEYDGNGIRFKAEKHNPKLSMLLGVLARTPFLPRLISLEEVRKWLFIALCVERITRHKPTTIQ